MIDPAEPAPAGGDSLVAPAPVTASGGVIAAEADPAAPDPDWQAERRALIDLLIYAWDRAKSPGVLERLAIGLEGVGVEVVRPDGEIFDPARHEVGAVEPDPGGSRHDTIAETELAGFVDRGRVIRDPVVVVYRAG